MTQDNHNAVFEYIGTCVDIDQAGEIYGFDPTEFAQAEESAKEEGRLISPAVFWKLIAIVPEGIKNKLLKNINSEYGYDDYLSILWAYEPDEDVHYFFR